MIYEFDDFGCTHKISDMCESHDCRNALLDLKKVNPDFKVTLFAIPGEMTAELTGWCQLNRGWVEIAVHGFYHQSNYECEKLSYDDFDFYMREFNDILKTCFVKGFRAPGWQISDGIFRWLKDHDYWVADQGYNDTRRPKELAAYVNYDGQFTVLPKSDLIKPTEVDAWHGHTWNCVGNGIYETFEQLESMVKDTKEFKFISEVVK
jgi:hypothetical protein